MQCQNVAHTSINYSRKIYIFVKNKKQTWTLLSQTKWCNKTWWNWALKSVDRRISVLFILKCIVRLGLSLTEWAVSDKDISNVLNQPPRLLHLSPWWSSPFLHLFFFFFSAFAPFGFTLLLIFLHQHLSHFFLCFPHWLCSWVSLLNPHETVWN